MDKEAYERQLAQRIEEVFLANPRLFDHRQRFPGWTNSLGDPFAGIWFLGEFPSLGRLDHERFPTTNPEAQWNLSPGDRLFRRALVSAGLKTGDTDSPGGWRCYVTNLIKEAEHSEARRTRKSERAMLADAELWAPVLRWQIEAGRPRLVVLMGGRLARLAEALVQQGSIELPKTTHIESYAYVASRPAGKLGPMHPDRVSAYLRTVQAAKERFDGLT